MSVKIAPEVCAELEKEGLLYPPIATASEQRRFPPELKAKLAKSRPVSELAEDENVPVARAGSTTSAVESKAGPAPLKKAA